MAKSFKAMIKFSVLFLSLLLLMGCGEKKTLPQADFPLDKETVDAAAETYGIDYPFEEVIPDPVEGLERSIFSIYLSDFKTAGNLGTGTKDGASSLSLNLVAPRIVPEGQIIPQDQFPGFAEESWPNLIKFCSNLYGGFKSDNQVYLAFKKAYDGGNLEQSGDYDGVFETKIGDIHCYIVVGYAGNGRESDCLKSVKFTDNKDIFPFTLS